MAITKRRKERRRKNNRKKMVFLGGPAEPDVVTADVLLDKGTAPNHPLASL